MYFSDTQLIKALKLLEKAHIFFGVTFLVCKQAGLPVGHAIEFAINQEEKLFLENYYRPMTQSDWYYRPLRTSDKSQYWLRPDYASSGSQKTRTSGTFGQAFIHSKGTNLWGWKENYVEILQHGLYKSRLIPAFALSVWLFREVNWPNETSPQDIINTFTDQFNLTEDEKSRLFDMSIPNNGDLEGWLTNNVFSWERISNELKIPSPIDIPPDEGGVLSFLSLQGIGPAKVLEFELAERVNLLTGDNGLGKTFILDCAWWALSGNWSSFPAYPRPDAKRGDPQIHFEIASSSGKRNRGASRYNWEIQDWSLPEDRPTIPGLLIYARADGAFAVWDPSRDYWSTTTKPIGVKPLIFSREEVWNGIRDNTSGQTTFLANGLIQDWINWQNSADKHSFNILEKVLKRLSPPSLELGDLGPLEPGKPTRIARDSRLIPTVRHSYGEIPIVYASSGVRRIVALAYLIVWAWQEHQEQSRLIRKAPQNRIVILVDEAESHLHPQWQRAILPALLDVRKDLDEELRVQLILATHSPLVMASVEPFFDASKDKIFHIDLVRSDLFGTEVKVQNIDFVRYGTVDSWLRSEVFELGQARSIEAEKAIEDAKKLQEQEDVTPELVKEVSERLMKYLPTHGDGFWPRWTFFARQYGVDL
jgi:hypothetical protein